jgi:hypothetical protein
MTPDEAIARPENVADWELERFRLGELPDAEMKRIGDLVAADGTLRLRLDGLERSSEEIVDEVSPRIFAAGVRERLQAAPPAKARRSPLLSPAWGGATMALVAAVALVFVVTKEEPLPSPVPGPETDVTRIKGLEPGLEIYRQTASGPEALEDGSPARLDDVIQIAYQAGGQKYGVIASLDGRGLVTVHFPAGGRQAAELSSGKVALEAAYRLDDAPRFERFFFVTSNEPFTVDQVIAAVRSTAPAGGHLTVLELPDSMKQASVELKKVSNP